MEQYVDAEYTSNEPQSSYDPVTGEVMEATPVQSLARMEQGRGHMAIGAPAALAMAVKEKSLMEARMAIARERPRDWMHVRDRLLRECDRPGFADAAIYSKPVAGQKIEGMSIRFAEACIRNMGNLRTTTELVEDEPKKVVYRVTVMDLESGSSFDDEITLTKTVERSTLKDGQVPVGERTNSRGKKTYVVLATDDELANKKGAAVSKVIRNAVLRLMPGDIVDECRLRAERTIANRDAKNPQAARNALLDAFSALGVSPKQVAEYLGKESAELITASEVTKMRPVYQAMKDEGLTWKDILESKPGNATKTGPVAPVPAQNAPPAAAPTTAVEATSPAPVPSPASEALPVEADPVENEKNAIRAAMRAAKTRKELQPLLERIRALPENDKRQMEVEYRDASKNVQ